MGLSEMGEVVICKWPECVPETGLKASGARVEVDVGGVVFAMSLVLGGGGGAVAQGLLAITLTRSFISGWDRNKV